MKFLSAVMLSLLPLFAWAQPPVTVPEPETLLLIGLGVAALLAVRRKRK
jgi:hypothetical protein